MLKVCYSGRITYLVFIPTCLEDIHTSFFFILLADEYFIQYETNLLSHSIFDTTDSGIVLPDSLHCLVLCNYFERIQFSDMRRQRKRVLDFCAVLE